MRLEVRVFLPDRLHVEAMLISCTLCAISTAPLDISAASRAARATFSEAMVVFSEKISVLHHPDHLCRLNAEDIGSINKVFQKLFYKKRQIPV